MAAKIAKSEAEKNTDIEELGLRGRELEMEGLEKQNFYLSSEVEVWKKERESSEVRCGQVEAENAELVVVVRGVREAKEGREAEYRENFDRLGSEVTHLRKIICDLHGNASGVKRAFGDEGGAGLDLEKSICNLEGLLGGTRIGLYSLDFEADKEGGFADSYMGCGIPLSARSRRRSTFLKPSSRTLARFPSIIDKSDMGPLPDTFLDDSQLNDAGLIKKPQLLTVSTKNMTVVVPPAKGPRSGMESPDQKFLDDYQPVALDFTAGKGAEKIDVATQVGVGDFGGQQSGSGLLGGDDISIVDD